MSKSAKVVLVRVHLSAQTRTWLACAFRRSASLFDDGKQIFLASSWLAKLGRTRAPREQVRLFAWTLFLSPLPHPGEVGLRSNPGEGTLPLRPVATPPHPDLLPARGEKEDDCFGEIITCLTRRGPCDENWARRSGVSRGA